ncbi:hypothetical protein A2U01_0086015, partial [Trifolium medium]|nr:hypothetical protein [Trifolium medium]
MVGIVFNVVRRGISPMSARRRRIDVLDVESQDTRLMHVRIM